MRSIAEILVFFSPPGIAKVQLLSFFYFLFIVWTFISLTLDWIESRGFGCGNSALVLHAKIILASILLSLICTSITVKPKAEIVLLSIWNEV